MTFQLGQNLGTYRAGFSATEMPFLNIFKTSEGWSCTGDVNHVNYDENSINLDSNGYPINALVKTGSPAALAGNTGFTNQFSGTHDFNVSILSGFYTAVGTPAPYPPGRYVLLWTGSGDITGGFNASGALIYNGSHRKIYDITPTFDGMVFTIQAIPNESNNPNVTNMTLIYSPDATSGIGGSTTPGVNGTGTHEALYNAGGIFNQMLVMQNTSSSVFGQTLGIPFLDHCKPFSFLRFMDWGFTNANNQSTWSQRVIPTYFHWYAAPYEIMTALCNDANADGWFCIPVLADSTYNANMASMIANGDGGSFAGLNSNLKAYVEFGNEVWQFSTLGLPATQEATAGYVAYSGLQAFWGTFNGYIDNNSTPGTYSGVAGNKLTVTSTPTGSTGGFGTLVQTLIGDGANRLFWSGVTGINRVVSQNSGTSGGIGVYTIDTTLAVAPTAMKQGSDFNAMLYNSIRLSVIYGNVWRSTFSNPASVVRVRSTAGGGVTLTAVLTFTASQFSGNASDWTGKSGDAANCDAYTFNSYFGNTNPPGSDTLAQFFTQVTSDVSAEITLLLARYNEVAGLGLTAVPLFISYEGGASYYPGGDSTKQTLYAHAARATNIDANPNYYQEYTTWLTGLRDTAHLAGVGHFADCGRYSDFTGGNEGNFGVFENMQQTTTSKYQALIDFIGSLTSIQPIRADLTISRTAPNRTVFIPPTKRSIKIHGPHYRGGLN